MEGAQMKKSILILLFLGMIELSACNSEKEKNSSDDVKNFCKQYASDYTLIKNDDKTCVVSVEAPDFEKIVGILLEDGEQELNVDLLEQIIDNNPDYTKEYVVNVENEDTLEIEEAFLEQVSYELMVSAIQNVEYEEDWGTEE